MKNFKWLIIAAPVGLLLVAGWALNTWPPTNRAQTSPDADEPILRTRRYPRSLNEVRGEVRGVIRSLKTYGKPWRESVPLNNGLPGFHVGTEQVSDFLYAEVPVLIFTDILKVTMEGDDRETIVNVHSNSQVGKGDFGENRRHIVQFLTALDARMQKTAP